MVGCQLLVEKPAGDRKAIIAAGENRVEAKAKGRLARAAGYHGALDAQPSSQVVRQVTLGQWAGRS